MDPFKVKSKISTELGEYSYYSLPKLFEQGIGRADKLPVSIRVLLENVLRNMDGKSMSEADVKNLANWNPADYKPVEVNFLPARVVLQDFTGVPAVVDLAALRSAMSRLGGDPTKINPHRTRGLGSSTTPSRSMSSVASTQSVSIPNSSLKETLSDISSSTGGRKRLTTLRLFHLPPESFTRSTLSTWLA